MIAMRRSLQIAVATLPLAIPAYGACGFCATEVTLSQGLAECYLSRLEAEIEKARSANLDVHLIELAACGVERGGSPMAQPQIVGSDDIGRGVDQAFFIPVSAMPCLALALREAAFDERDGTVRVEVRDDC